jgi:hypothetical protein
MHTPLVEPDHHRQKAVVTRALVLLALFALGTYLFSRGVFDSGPPLPVYPGASVIDTGTSHLFGLTKAIRRSSSFTIAFVKYRTTAPAEQVLAFSRQQLEKQGYYYDECCTSLHNGGHAGPPGIIMGCDYCPDGYSDGETIGVDTSRDADGQLLVDVSRGTSRLLCDCLGGP